MDTILAMVAWALGVWGFGGVAVDVQLDDIPWGAAAQTSPDTPRSMVITLDRTTWAASTPDEQRRRILHEVGHGLGATYYQPAALDYWRDHNDDPASVMYPFYEPGQTITARDRARIHAVLVQELRAARIVIPGVVQ